MSRDKKAYLPAAGHDWLLPFYDPLGTLLGADKARRALLAQASLRSGHRILDIGCGTGALTLLIKRLHPDVEVIGLDPDPKALARAKRKAARAELAIQFDQGFSDALPYSAASLDHVFSSLMFHHLPREGKEKTLHQLQRVLKPGGIFHMMDLVGPPARRDNLLARAGHSRDHMADTTEDRVVALMKRAGFTRAEKVGDGRLLFWRIAYYRAQRENSA